MTVWDKAALEAPHTLREMAQDGEPAPGSTTEPENAICQPAGGSMASGGHDKICHLAVLDAIAAEKAEWPHAGVMHAAARTACDNIAERVKKLMGVA